MNQHLPHKPHHKSQDEDDDPEPGLLPVDPDTGPLQPALPSDPEHDRDAGPEV